MSGELTSVEMVLEKHLPEQELAEVKRILYGRPARALDVGEECTRVAGDGGYEVAGWVIDAQHEETRPPRKVTLALIQNKIVLPTDAPISEQIAALHARVGGMIENAGKSGAQVVCLQEAWSKLRLLIQKHLQIISVIYPYHTHRTHYLEEYTKYLSRFNIETLCPSHSVPEKNIPGHNLQSLLRQGLLQLSSPS